MAPRMFITGVTGYIGGDVLYALYKAHPDYEYHALIRTEEKADIVKKSYTSLNTVLGRLDDHDIIKEQAAKADIVIRRLNDILRVHLTWLDTADASDNEGAAKAIAEGLAKGHSRERPGFWLHTGGAGIFTYKDSEADRLGESSDDMYDDWEGVGELTSLPDSAFHRNVDKIVIEAGTKHSDSVKTALLCPPTIYGKGRGPTNVRSRQSYELAKVILTEKYVPIVGAGKAVWPEVHVADLTDAFLLLVDAAISHNLSSEIWGAKGYYIIENGSFVWGDLARLMGKKAAELGFISNPESKPLSKDAAMKQAGFEAVSWGLNSRCKGIRAKKVLGWQPSMPRLEEEVPNILKEEHKRLSKS